MQGVPTEAELRGMSIERITEILAVEDMLKEVFKTANDIAYKYLMQGGFVPGYKLVEARAARKWWDAEGSSENTARALMRLIGTEDLDDVYPRKLITITEAENWLKRVYREAAPRGQKKQAAEMAGKALAALTLKESSGSLVMVETSDTRPAYDRVKNVFHQVVAPQQIGKT